MKPSELETRLLIQTWIEQENREQRAMFYELNPKGGWYTQEQKRFAIEKARTIGVRATLRLLKVPRRTIQRWLRKEGIVVKRCPDWVFEWAARRKKKRRFW